MRKLVLVALVVLPVVWCRAACAQNTSSFENMDEIRAALREAAAALPGIRAAATRGDAKAQFELGQMYEEGTIEVLDGVESRDDAPKAVAWYRKSAEQGYAPAQYKLGWMYANGYGLKKDMTQALSWYRKAAKQGEARALVNLGELYETGKDVAQDSAQAVAWFRKAAELGNAWGQIDLGAMYEAGDGVAQSSAQAAAWYQKAAQQGYVQAQLKLGVMYEVGEGVAQDDAQALTWYQTALAQAKRIGDDNTADAQYGIERLALKSQTPDVATLVKQALHDMVFVPGGTFMMGDFGAATTPDRLPYSWQAENKPAHKVTLDGFSISRHKVTYAELDAYAKAVGKPAWPHDVIAIRYKRPDFPAGVPWQMAKDYCQWLGRQSGLPIDLPTEAQWEYAARSGGKPLIFATDNGKWEPDRNLPSYDMSREKLNAYLDLRQTDSAGTYAVGQFPPNPLGLYDMGMDGRDWVSDWFDGEYYAHSPEANPQGPATGQRKVIRGAESVENSDTAMTIYRGAKIPAPYIADRTFGTPSIASFVETTFRCAVQKPTPID